MTRRFIVKCLWVVVVLTLLTTPFLALADDIANNLDGSIDATLEDISLTVGGGNGTVGLLVQPTGTGPSPSDGKSGCNLTGSSTLVVSVNSSNTSVATVSPSSITFVSCGDIPAVTVIPVGAGSATISLSQVSNNTGGTFNLDPASFTVIVTSADTTPPVITPNVSGTLGANGWYVSDVTVNWTVVDNESAIISSNGCGPTTITADTAGTTLTCTATSAGGTSSESVTIKRDATAPTISGSASPAPNGAGWNNTDVTVSFSCADNLSGVASCGPDQTLSSEGAGQSATGIAVDNAGNSTSATVSGINIDKIAPVVSVTGVEDGATYTLGSVPTAGCSTTDALSGVASEATLSLSGGPVGSITATCSGAEDNAGNNATAEVSYSVIYDWDGFFRPVENHPSLNVVKAGSAVPVKFNLGGYQGLNILEAGYPRSQVINCDGSAAEDVIIAETVTAGKSTLTYDEVAQQYIYVWKTEKSWAGTCRELQLELNDGTYHGANFKLTK